MRHGTQVAVHRDAFTALHVFAAEADAAVRNAART
jgi:hypothetical protein